MNLSYLERDTVRSALNTSRREAKGVYQEIMRRWDIFIH